MASFEPRPPYSEEELKKLFPKELDLVQVQIILRHGERTPTSPRFQNAGLTPHWPYCSAAKRFKAVVMASPDGSEWNELAYRRRMENFGSFDLPVDTTGPNGEMDNICALGELTDKGRSTTLALGQRLRHLYVSQLGFLPLTLTSASEIYLRASPYPRALESVQQSFYGLFPSAARAASMEPPIIHARNIPDETMFDNSGNCKRMGQLSRAFAQRAAERWNNTEDMKYLTKKLGKWMPESSPQVKIDSHPRLSGIMDTSSSTLAHGPATRLPKEFYEEKTRSIIDKAAVDEWFSGYTESLEYRRLGWGAMVGDIVSRMVGVVVHEKNDVALPNSKLTRLAMSGAHDTTLAGFLSSLGAFENECWPKFTSHVAIELFKANSEFDAPVPSNKLASAVEGGISPASDRKDVKPPAAPRTSWFSSLFGLGGGGGSNGSSGSLVPLTRKRTEDLSPSEREQLRDYFVRIRYNDKPVTIPGCRLPGRHLDSNGHKDESFCTLEAFKAIADAFTPKDWKKECSEGLDRPVLVPKTESERELAGYAPGDLEKL